MAPLLQEELGKTDSPPIGDVEMRRATAHRMFDYIASTWKPVAGVQLDRHTLTTADGAKRWYLLNLAMWWRTFIADGVPESEPVSTLA